MSWMTQVKLLSVAYFEIPVLFGLHFMDSYLVIFFTLRIFMCRLPVVSNLIHISKISTVYHMLSLNTVVSYLLDPSCNIFFMV